MNGLAKKVLVLVGLVVGSALAAACSSSSSGSGSTPCNENPFECPTGQTCWVETDETTFTCLNQGNGGVGATCMATPGEPQCGAGLFCLQTTAASGACLQFCEPTDPAHACPNNGACEPVAFTSGTAPSVYLCAPSTTPVDGGTTPPDAATVDTGAASADTGAHEAATD